MVENPRFPALIHESQQDWRHARRRILSRPVSLDRLSKNLSQGIRSTFKDYIPQDSPDVQMSWSILADKPKQAPLYYFEPLIPVEVKEEDEEHYLNGITMLDEYATNFAAKEYMQKQPKTALARHAMSLIGKIADLGGFALPYHEAYSTMRKIATDTPKALFRHALYSAYFLDEPEQLDQIIQNAEIENVTSVATLAVWLGKKLHILRLIHL